MRDSRKIVAAIVGLGHSLDLITVAEGIETEEQANMPAVVRLRSRAGIGFTEGLLRRREVPRIIVASPRPIQIGLATPTDGWGSSQPGERFQAQRLAQLQAIYDGAPVGLCFLDRNLRYVSLNRKLAEMNGSTVAAHLGKSLANGVCSTPVSGL